MEGENVVYRRGAFTDGGSLSATLEPHLVDTKRSVSYGEVGGAGGGARGGAGGGAGGGWPSAVCHIVEWY